jgi:hypothetical protein
MTNVNETNRKPDAQFGDTTHDSVNTVEALLKADGPNPSKPRAAPLHIRGQSNAHGIILQNQDDTVQNQEGKANIYWYSDAGERIGAITAHPFDNQYSVYTKAGPIGDGDTGLSKRWDLSGGSDDSLARLTSINGSATLNIDSDSGSNSAVNYVENGDEKARIQYKPGADAVFFEDVDNSANDIIWYLGNQLNFTGLSLVGLREIDNPTAADTVNQEFAWDSTNDRWLYEDSGGTVHYFTPDGTL